MRRRVVALGNPHRGDDGAGLMLARSLPDEVGEVVLAGRPGAGLLELLDPEVPTVIVDCVRSGRPPGAVVVVPLGRVAEVAAREPRASSHGVGPADALALAAALGRPLPRGAFVGCEGASFEPGDGVSEAVARAMQDWRAAVVAALEAACTSRD